MQDNQNAPQQPMPPQGYGPQQPTPPPQTASTNGMAIASLVCAFLIPIVGLILGIISLGKIKTSGEGGRGLAMAGIIISSIGMVLGLIFVILFFIGLGAATSDPYWYY